MIRKIKKILRTVAGGIIPALSLSLVMSSVAWALSSGTGIVLKNGQIGLTDDSGAIATSLPVAAGTLLGSVAEGDTFYASSATEIAKLAKGADGQVWKLASGIPSWAADDDAWSKSLVIFTSETKIDLNGSVTYMGAGGRVCDTQANCLTPVQTATSFTNLICYASGAVGGTSLTVKFGDGDCTGALTYGTLASVPTGTTPVNNTNTESVDSAECFALSLTAVGDTNAVFINCTVEKAS